MARVFSSFGFLVASCLLAGCPSTQPKPPAVIPLTEAANPSEKSEPEVDDGCLKLPEPTTQQYVLISPSTRLYRKPRQKAGSFRPESMAFVDETIYSHREYVEWAVARELDDWVEIESRDTSFCHAAPSSFSRLRVRAWVRKDDVAKVLVDEIETTFQDGAKLTLSPGQVIALTVERAVAPTEFGNIDLPDAPDSSKYAWSYVRDVNPRGYESRAKTNWMVRENGFEYARIKVDGAPVEAELQPAELRDLDAAPQAVRARVYGACAILEVDAPRVAFDPYSTGPTDEGIAVLEGPDTQRVDAGRDLYFDDGTPAGITRCPTVFYGPPRTVDGRLCYEVNYPINDPKNPDVAPVELCLDGDW